MGPLSPLLSFLIAHSGDSADPEFLHWVKDRIDQIVGPGPWLVIGLITLLIISIPVAIVVFYLFQRRRQDALVRDQSADEP
jgi:hypothetical protein